jgi:hypothetical protein
VEELHQVPMDRRFETKGNVALIQPVWKAEKVILERWGVY